MKTQRLPLSQRNREANQRLYDVDPRIFDTVHRALLHTQASYFTAQIGRLWTETRGTRFLDIGCGTGWLLRMGQHYFPCAIGIDLSRSLTKAASGLVVCGDATALPFHDRLFDSVALSFTLHHVYDRLGLLNEISRVLVPGGLLYVDNEANASFHRRFRLLVRLHDLLNGLDKRYRALDDILDRQTVDLAEYYGYQKGGIDPSVLQRELIQAGLEPIHLHYHWYGISPAINRICAAVRLRHTPSSVPPQFCIMARRPKARGCLQ